MKLLKSFRRKELKYKDTDIIALGEGVMIAPNDIGDMTFSKELMGQTIGFKLDSGDIASPANGVVEMMFPTRHAFAIRMCDGSGILVHIGIDTVSLQGEGFKSMVKQGDQVFAGQRVINADFDKIKASGFDITTMLVVSEPVEGKCYSFIEFGPVSKNQIIRIDRGI